MFESISRRVSAPARTGRGPVAPQPPRDAGFGLRGLRGRHRRGSPLFRNAYALMLNTGLSAGWGFAYWLLAAHYYSDSAVGRGSAAIAAMKLLAGLAAVTLPGALTRFIPAAGPRTGKLITGTYLSSALAVAVAAGVFLLLLGLWGPSYQLLHGVLPGLGFVAAVVGWAVLTLQDGVLTGLRSAVWVPVGNTVFSVAKIVLLVMLAAVIPTAGVYVSWVAAIALSVVPLGWLVFRRLVPRHIRATEGEAEPPGARQIGRFLAGDGTGSLFSLAVMYLVPVVVAARISPALNAYFYITVLIAYTLDLLAINMGASLTVEGSHAPARLAELSRAALWRMALIMIPICLLLVILAPLILGVFGPGYATHGAPLLRLMAIATLTRVLFEVYFAVLRVQSRTSRVALLQGLLCVLVLGSTLVLLGPLSIAGAGVAELAGQSVIAVIACFGLVRALRGSPAAPRTDARTDAGDPVESVPPPPPDRPGRRLRSRLPRLPWAPLLGWLVLGAAVALFWLPLRGMNDGSLARMNGLGLISALPHLTLLGAGLLVVTFAWGLRLRTPHPWLLLATLLATVVSLHGVPAVLEAYPRFPIAWEHAGFVDFVQRTGSLAPHLDGRFCWPGFFLTMALVAKAGIADPTQLMRWWTLALQLLYLAPLFLLLRAVRATWRAKWWAAWLFVVGGWVGQDYFSPQSFGYLLYLLFVAVLLVWFREARQDAGDRIPGEAEVLPIGRTQRALLLALLLGLFALATVSHPLTPFMMVGASAGLVFCRRSTLRQLPLLCLVVASAWIGYFVEGYWSGQPHVLFGSLGALVGNVSSITETLVAGGSGLHDLVLYVRVALAASVLTLAAYGWLRRRRAGIRDRAPLVLMLVPFLSLALHDYGGEIPLRAFLFALPAAAVLAALAFFPRASANGSHPWRGPIAALLAGLVLMGGFLVARWGNEPFERVRPGEPAAMNYVLAHDSPTARIMWLNADPSIDPSNDLSPNLPWRVTRDMENVRYEPIPAPRDPTHIAPVVRALKHAGSNSYLVVSRGSSAFLELRANYPVNWHDRVTTTLDRNTALRKVVSTPDSGVYVPAKPETGPVPPADNHPTGLTVTWTPWSVVGGIAVLLLIVILVTVEFVRVLAPRLTAGWRRAMRTSLWLAVPLGALVTAVLTDRFLTI